MKANELMVGDYLRINRDGLCIPKGKIVRVTEVDSENYFLKKGLKGCARCGAVGDPWLSGGIWCDYLDPIPLTPEILEKNGFHEKSSGVFVCEKFNTLPDYDWFCVYRMLNGKTYLEINSFISGLGTFSKSGVQYVHQLQHALRLCGIDKNIEI